MTTDLGGSLAIPTSPTTKPTNTVDKESSHTLAVRPKFDAGTPRWANGRPVITHRRAIAIAEKRQWEHVRTLLAKFVEADRIVEAFRLGKLENLVTFDQLAIGMTAAQVYGCNATMRRVLVRIASALLYFVAPGFTATHAQLSPLFMLSERQTRRVLHELAELAVLREPLPTFEAELAVHNRRANGYQLDVTLYAMLFGHVPPAHVHPTPVSTDRARVLGQKNGQASGTDHTCELRISAASPGPGGRDAALSTRVPECPATPDPEIDGRNAVAAAVIGPVTASPASHAPQQLRTAMVSHRSDVAEDMARIAAETGIDFVRELIASPVKSGGRS